MNRRQFLIGLGAAAMSLLLPKAKRVEAQEVPAMDNLGMREQSPTEKEILDVRGTNDEPPFTSVYPRAQAAQRAVASHPDIEKCTVVVSWVGSYVAKPVRFFIWTGGRDVTVEVSPQLLVDAVSIEQLADGIVARARLQLLVQACERASKEMERFADSSIQTMERFSRLYKPGSVNAKRFTVMDQDEFKRQWLERGTER